MNPVLSQVRLSALILAAPYNQQESQNPGFLNVNEDMKIELTEDNYDYIKYHRENVFQK